MKKPNLNKKQLYKIWKQVPPDYYEKAIKTNLLQRYWHNQKTTQLKKITKDLQPKTILDVGCAGGYMSNKISQIFPQAKITGVDVYKKAILRAKEKYPHIKFITADAHKLPFKNNSFDMVVCYETIEHVLDPQKTLKEIKRVLKKDGHAIIAMDSGNKLFRIIWFIWENTKGKVWKGSHLHPFHHKQLENLIKKTGFVINNKQFTHFGLEVVFLLTKSK